MRRILFERVLTLRTANLPRWQPTIVEWRTCEEVDEDEVDETNP